MTPGLEILPTPPESATVHAHDIPLESESDHAVPARFVTLGCKVNQYETEYLRELLLANGYRDARAGEVAHLAVVNTCTVTAESDSKSRQLIRRLARQNPGIRIVVTGCYAAADPDRVRQLPQVAAVVPDKRQLDAALAQFGVRRPIRGIRDFPGHQRAFVKMQDGCLLRCAFCIIPTVRPELTSRPVEEVVGEVTQLVANGFREIVLTGIHLGHYGFEAGDGRPHGEQRRLWQALERLARLPGEFRLRLSSLEATELTDDLLRVLADYSGKICPHLHLSLQSGSDRILAAMNRRYRVRTYLARIDRLRQLLDQPAFTTDIIVGFPGESPADFEQTIALAREVGFARMHIFPFSPRAGTPAADLPDRVPAEEIAMRQKQMAEVERELAGKYFQSLLGRRLEMLVESPDPERPGIMRGTACRYAPLRLATMPALGGRLIPVRARRATDSYIDVDPEYLESRPGCHAKDLARRDSE